MNKQATKTYASEATAEKAAASKTKKTGIEHYALEVEGEWKVMTTEEFDLLGSTEPESEPEPEEMSIHVNGSFEQIDTDPEDESTESDGTEALLEEVLGLMDPEPESEPESNLEEPIDSTDPEPKSEEPTDPVPEMVVKQELAPFGMKSGYTKELTIPFFGYQGLKYLKTSDPQGNRIRLAASRVHVVKVEGEQATIKTTPTYAAHRNFA